MPPKKEKVRNDKKPQDERPWFKLCSKCEFATVDVVCTACGELCDACDGVFHTRGAMAKHTRTPVPKPAPEEPEQKEQKGPLPKPAPKKEPPPRGKRDLEPFHNFILLFVVDLFGTFFKPFLAKKSKK